jgi:hypothetical protein
MVRIIDFTKILGESILLILRSNFYTCLSFNILMTVFFLSRRKLYFKKQTALPYPKTEVRRAVRLPVAMRQGSRLLLVIYSTDKKKHPVLYQRNPRPHVFMRISLILIQCCMFYVLCTGI